MFKNLWYKFLSFMVDQRYEVVKWAITYLIFGVIIILMKT